MIPDVKYLIWGALIFCVGCSSDDEPKDVRGGVDAATPPPPPVDVPDAQPPLPCQVEAPAPGRYIAGWWGDNEENGVAVSRVMTVSVPSSDGTDDVLEFYFNYDGLFINGLTFGEFQYTPDTPIGATIFADLDENRETTTFFGEFIGTTYRVINTNPVEVEINGVFGQTDRPWAGSAVEGGCTTQFTSFILAQE